MREIRNIILSLLLFVGLFSGLFFGALHITSQINNKEDSNIYVPYNSTTERIPDILPYTTPNNINKPLNTSSSTHTVAHTSTRTIYKKSTSPVTRTSTSPVTRTSASPVTRTSASPVTRTSASPVTRTSTSPVTETSTSPVTDTSTSPVTETSTSPVTETSTSPVTETSTSPVTETSTKTAESVTLEANLNENDQSNVFEVDSNDIEVFNPKIFKPIWDQKEKPTNSGSNCPNANYDYLSKLGFNIEDVIILHNDSILTMIVSPRNQIKNIDKYCRTMKPEIKELIGNISRNLNRSGDTTETRKLINVFETTLDFIKEHRPNISADEMKFREKQINLIVTNQYTKMVLNVQYSIFARTPEYILKAHNIVSFNFY